MQEHPLAMQSGNSRILELMNRGYDRAWYFDKVKSIREILGEECGISSDMITGFPTETEEDHQETVTLMDQVEYDFSYMFFYSERPGTPAAKKLKDDIPVEIKKRRLNEIIDKQTEISLRRNKKDVGKIFEVLIEGFSRRSGEHLQGRNSQNKVIVFPMENKSKGEYVHVLVEGYTRGTLTGKIVK